MTIVNPLPYNIQNGQSVDAVPVMANLNQIVNNVNANAAPAAGNPAQTFAVASATASGQAINLGQANSLYAPVSGNAAQTFAVANATASNQAVSLGQANSLYAPVSGNAAQTFAVANATATNQALARGQVLNISPQIFRFQGGTAASTAYNSTNTLTAPCNGFIIVYATVESSTNFNPITFSISNNGTVLAQDLPTANWTLNGFASVSSGSTNNVTVGYTVGSTALSTGLYVRAIAYFIPSP